MPGGPVNLSGDGALAALNARRAELQKIEQAGRDAEAELRALDAKIDKAENELQAHPLMIATMKAIAGHHLSDADARALIRAQRTAIAMALVGDRMAEQRDADARAARGADVGERG